jgi:hypothetical protein
MVKLNGSFCAQEHFVPYTKQLMKLTTTVPFTHPFVRGESGNKYKRQQIEKHGDDWHVTQDQYFE